MSHSLTNNNIKTRHPSHSKQYISQQYREPLQTETKMEYVLRALALSLASVGDVWLQALGDCNTVSVTRST